MGHGVANNEIFEALLEDRLNDGAPDAGNARYEILNFAAEGYSPPQQLAVLDRAFEFEPDTVFFVAHSADVAWSVRHLAKLYLQDIEIPYPFLQRVVDKGKLDKTMTPEEAERALKPYARATMEWVYGRIVERCRERGVRPVWIFLPKVKDYRNRSVAVYVEEAAERAGFDVLSLTGVYAGKSNRSLQVSRNDLHPNALAHGLIADRLFELLLARPELLSRYRMSTERP